MAVQSGILHAGATSMKPQLFTRRPGAGPGRRRLADQRGTNARKAALPPSRKRPRADDEEIESDSASGLEAAASIDSDSDEVEETTDESRVRLAKQYLRQLSASAKGQHAEKDSSSNALAGLEADSAFDSAAETSGGDEGSEDDDCVDNLFQDADSRMALTAQLKHNAQARKLSSMPVRALADSLRFGNPTFFKGHKLPVTCIALPGEGSADQLACGKSGNLHAYTGGKDCCVIRWDLETGKKDIFKGQRNCFGHTPAANGRKFLGGGHFRAVLDLCVAEDERILFSAGADHTVRAWDPRTSNARCMFELRGHRGPVTGVRFNGSSCLGMEGDTELLTCSADKSLKTWSVSCRRIANHYYGHASEVNCMDLLQGNKPITGGNDGTLRNWKLAQDTHTAFPPLGSCVDAVAVLSPSIFACGTQGGLLALFNSSCKKPLACVRVGQFAAPGKPLTPAETAEKLAAPLRATGGAMSVSALCALPMTDALLLGTEGGTVQVWSASQNDRKAGGGKLRAVPQACIQAGGAVTGLRVANDRSCVVAAVSTESRLGRWYKSEGSKNGICVLPVKGE